MPLSERILRIPRTAEGVCPGDGHLGERLGVGHAAVAKAAVADPIEGLVHRAEPDADRADRPPRAAAWERLGGEQNLTARLGHGQIERRLCAQLLRRELPHGDLAGEGSGRLERKERERRHHEPGATGLLQHLGEETDPLALDGLHCKMIAEIRWISTSALWTSASIFLMLASHSSRASARSSALSSSMTILVVLNSPF